MYNLSKAICLCMSSACYWMLWTYSDDTLKAMKCMPISFQSVLRNEKFVKKMSLWQSIGSFFVELWMHSGSCKALEKLVSFTVVSRDVTQCSHQRECTVWHLKRWLQKRLLRSYSLHTILLCLATSACIQNLTDIV